MSISDLNTSNPFYNLPDEVVGQIISYLPENKELISFSLVCKRFSKIARDTAKTHMTQAIEDLTAQINKQLAFPPNFLLAQELCKAIKGHNNELASLFNSPEVSISNINSFFINSEISFPLISVNVLQTLVSTRGGRARLQTIIDQANEDDLTDLIQVIDKLYELSQGENPPSPFLESYQAYQKRAQVQKTFTQRLQNQKEVWLSDIAQSETFVDLKKTAFRISCTILPFMQKLSKNEQIHIYNSLYEKHPFFNDYFNHLQNDHVTDVNKAYIEYLFTECPKEYEQLATQYIEAFKEISPEEYAVLSQFKNIRQAQHKALCYAKEDNFERAKEEIQKISDKQQINHGYREIAEFAAKTDNPDIALTFFKQMDNEGNALFMAFQSLKQIFEEQGLTEKNNEVLMFYQGRMRKYLQSFRH